MSTDKRVFTLRMRPENFDKVRVLAAINKRSVAKQIEFLVEKSIKEYEEHHGAIPLLDEDRQSQIAINFTNQVGDNNLSINKLG